MILGFSAISLISFGQTPQNITDSVLAKRDLDSMNERAKRQKFRVDTTTKRQINSDSITKERGLPNSNKNNPTNPQFLDSPRKYNPVPPPAPVEKH